VSHRVYYGAAKEDPRGEVLWHIWRVQLREPERGFAELTVLLLRVGQPLHQAILVDMLDGAAALARVE
jgi:hypothetical protein